MKIILTLLLTLYPVIADNVKDEVDQFLKKLDGNFRERKEASKQLGNLPVEFYPYLKKHLEQDELSMEIKLRLTKEKMFPLRYKWLHEQRMNWYKKNIVDAYEEFGHKSPKWDKDVKDAFKVILRQFNEYWRIKTYSERIAAACQKAVIKGCRDPLIMFFLARGEVDRLYGSRNLQLKKLHLNAAKLLKNSKYHSYFKFRSTRLAAYYIRLDDNKNTHTTNKSLYAKTNKKLLEAVPYFKGMLNDKDFPFVEYFYNTVQYCDVFYDISGSLEYAFNRLKPLIEHRYGKDSMEIMAVAGAVKVKKSFKRISKVYEDAQTIRTEGVNLLSKAWKKDPARKEIATQILNALKNGDNKELFEKSYNNVLLADPDNFEAFFYKKYFISQNGSIEDLWNYGEEIVKRGGRMVFNLPDLLNEIGIKLADQDSKLLFDFHALYRNDRAWHLLKKGFEGLLVEFPDDSEIPFMYANYASYMGYWSEAHQQFLKAGLMKDYKGQVRKSEILERQTEAEIYATRNIKPDHPLHIDYKKRLQETYKKKKSTGLYNFWKLYQGNKMPNAEQDSKVKEVLATLSESWSGNPKFQNNHLETKQIPYEKLTEIRKSGNEDPLIHILWADLKDHYSKGGKSESFQACQSVIESKYPDSIKLWSVCIGISRLSSQIVISDKEKSIVEMLIKRIPDYITGDDLVFDQFHGFFAGLAKLNLISNAVTDSIANKYKSLGKMTQYHLIHCYYNNQMAFYTYRLSKKKNWQLINLFKRKSKDAIKNAWKTNPLNPQVASALFSFTDYGQDDYFINFRRAMYTNIEIYSSLNKWMDDIGTSAFKWTLYPDLGTQVILLHYKQVEKKAQSDKHSQDIRLNNWDTVSNSFLNYLSKFPNDTINRSKFAVFAIKCNKTNVAKEQLTILGKYAYSEAFGGDDKLKEYQDRYLK